MITIQLCKIPNVLIETDAIFETKKIIFIFFSIEDHYEDHYESSNEESEDVQEKGVGGDEEQVSLVFARNKLSKVLRKRRDNVLATPPKSRNTRKMKPSSPKKKK